MKMIGIRKEERPIALIALIVFALLNGLLIYNHYDSFTRGAHVGFWSVFYNHAFALGCYAPSALCGCAVATLLVESLAHATDRIQFCCLSDGSCACGL